jgi:hypothetical protein
MTILLPMIASYLPPLASSAWLTRQYRFGARLWRDCDTPRGASSVLLPRPISADR